MSHSFVDHELVFNCDTCDARHRAGGAKFRETWREAVALGWTTYVVFVDGISSRRAACPRCSKRRRKNG